MASILSRPQWVKTVFVDQMTSFRMTHEIPWSLAAVWVFSTLQWCSLSIHIHAHDHPFQCMALKPLSVKKATIAIFPQLTARNMCHVSISRRSFYAWELPLDRLIFIMGIVLLARRHICVRTGSQVAIISLWPTNATTCMWSLSPVHQLRNDNNNNTMMMIWNETDVSRQNKAEVYPWPYPWYWSWIFKFWNNRISELNHRSNRHEPSNC